MSHLLRFPLLLLAIAFVCQSVQGQPHQDSRLQGERSIWPNWANREDAKTISRIQSPLSQFHVIDTALVLQPQGDTLRNVYTFNANAMKTSNLLQAWAGEHWVNHSRVTNTYDTRNNMLTEGLENWSEGLWVSDYRRTYTYDASNNHISSLYENWRNGVWVITGTDTSTYDAKGNELSLVSWGYYGGQRTTRTYDGNGNEILWLYEKWANDRWVQSYRYTSTHDARGNRVSFIGENWAGGEWRREQAAVFTYDASNNMISETYESWFDGRYSKSRQTYAYDASNRLLSRLAEIWKDGQWVNWQQTAYTCDEHNLPYSELTEEWIDGQWVYASRYFFNHDVAGNLISVVHHAWDNSSWVPEWMYDRGYSGFHVYDNAGNEYSYHGWSLTFKYKTIVTEVVAGTGDVPVQYALSQNYPNPFNPNTTIEFALPHSSFVTLKVYNLLGEAVATLVEGDHAAGTFNTTWDASGLPSGVYFYRLTAGEYVQTKKMVLIR